MNRHLNRAANLLLLLLCILPLMALIVESLGCVIEPSFYLWAGALCVLGWFSASFKRGILVGMPLSGLLLYGAYRKLGADPRAELEDLFDKITGAYYEHFYAPGSSYGYTHFSDGNTLVLLLLAFLLASYMAAALTSRSGRIAMSFMGTVPILLGCVAVNGTPPVLPIVCLLLFWALALVSGRSYEADSGSGKAVFATLLPVLLLLGVLLLFHTPQSYSYDQRDIRLSQQLDRFSRVFNRWLGGKAEQFSGPVVETIEGQDDSGSSLEGYGGWHNAAGDMDLTEDFDAAGMAEAMLSVRAEVSGTLYLRSLSYGDYTGTGWTKAEDSPYSSLSFVYAAIQRDGSGEELGLELRPSAGFSYQLLPYFSASDGGTDSAVSAPRRGSYSVRYLRFKGDYAALSLPTELLDAELAYRDYAHSVYTRLPEETRAAALALCAENGLSPDSPELIAQVAAFVQSAGVYDLATEPYPSDDYALYFLTQAKRGYCIHFATAATVLYRALGIPARVTEGFLFEAEAGQYTAVKAGNAHAWVEVYRDGLGWVPVEVTGRSAGLEPEPQPQESPEPTAPEEPEPTLAPEEETPAPAATQEPLPVGLITDQTQEGGAGTGGEVRRVSGKTLLLVLLALLLLAAPFLWVALARWLFRRRTRQEDGKRAAVAVWQYARRVAVFGGEVPEAITACAERASFSQHGITDGELSICRTLLENEAHRVYARLKPLRRLLFRLRTGII